LASDIHLEFGALETPMPEGEVLILAGDITLIGALDPEDDLYGPGAVVRERTFDFLKRCRHGFERIFYLIGNHEPYHYDLTRTPNIIRRWLSGVELLDNRAVALTDDVMLVGGTLWTDMNKGRDAILVGRVMNDFRIIRIADEDDPQGGQTRVLHPRDAMAMFEKTKRCIAETARANPDKTIVVATHHAPSVQGLNVEHTRGSATSIDAAYYTDLHAFIEGLPNIKWWLHGHTHLQKAYRIGQCHVLSNARGYIGHERCADAFDPDCWFDPVTGETHGPGQHPWEGQTR
jgi:hypothetical protein